MNYTQAQIDRANAVSLEDFLRTQGETLIKSGREYRWKEHDSLTVRGNKWFRHSQSKGGYPIDFVMEFYGKSFPEAVQMLTGENGEGQTEATTAPPTAFHLPLHNRTADRAIQYLCESRGLNKTLVEAFLLSGDIYEDAKRHNVVFVGRDRSGTPRYAHVRGTADPFRQDIAGADKSYPFRYEGNGNQLFGFEDIRQPVQRALRLRDGERLALEHREVVPVGFHTDIAAVLSAVGFDIFEDRICLETAVWTNRAFFNCLFQQVNIEVIAHKLIAAEGVRVVIHPDDLVRFQIHVESVLLVNILRHYSSPPFMCSVISMVSTGSGNFENRSPVLASETPDIRSFSLPTVELISFWFSA